jgi:hypothetical protein
MKKCHLKNALLRFAGQVSCTKHYKEIVSGVTNADTFLDPL